MKKKELILVEGEIIEFIHQKQKEPMTIKMKGQILLVISVIIVSLIYVCLLLISRLGEFGYLMVGLIITTIFFILISILFVGGDEVCYYTSKRIVEKRGKKEREIRYEDIGVVVVRNFVEIIARDENRESCIKLDEPFDGEDEKSIFRNHNSILLKRADPSEVLTYLRKRLKFVKYEKIEESRVLVFKKYEGDPNLDKGLRETINEYYDNIKDIYIVLQEQEGVD